jgi:hypothetical protein
MVCFFDCSNSFDDDKAVISLRPKLITLLAGECDHQKTEFQKRNVVVCLYSAIFHTNRRASMAVR